MMLEQEFMNFVLEKARDENAIHRLEEAKYIISELTKYLHGKNDILESKLREYLDTLVGFSTITLDFNFSNLEIIRGVKTSEITNVERVSYIKNPEKGKPATGRLNPDGKTLFYGVVLNKSYDDALDTVLAELGIKITLEENNNETTCFILQTKLAYNEDLICRIIGFWSYIESKNLPYYLPKLIAEYCQTAWQFVTDNTPKNLLEAYKITDNFFKDIMEASKGTYYENRLYNLSSILGEYFLEALKVDAILYPSVARKGAPNIAIKPNSIDNKFTHQNICKFVIKSNNLPNKVNETQINIDGTLAWRHAIPDFTIV